MQQTSILTIILILVALFSVNSGFSQYSKVTINSTPAHIGIYQAGNQIDPLVDSDIDYVLISIGLSLTNSMLSRHIVWGHINLINNTVYNSIHERAPPFFT